MKPGYELNHRYKIIESLGEGGMANVYLAHDLVLDILANHHPQPISEEKVKAVEAVVQACIDRK